MRRPWTHMHGHDHDTLQVAMTAMAMTTLRQLYPTHALAHLTSHGPSLIFAFISPLFSCLHLPNYSLSSSITSLHSSSLCKPRRAMPLVALPSVHPRFPSHIHIRGSPRSSMQYSPILHHHCQLHLLAHLASENLIRCLSRHCA